MVKNSQWVTLLPAPNTASGKTPSDLNVTKFIDLPSVSMSLQYVPSCYVQFTLKRDSHCFPGWLFCDITYLMGPNHNLLVCRERGHFGWNSICLWSFKCNFWQLSAGSQYYQMCNLMHNSQIGWDRGGQPSQVLVWVAEAVRHSLEKQESQVLVPAALKALEALSLWLLNTARLWVRYCGSYLAAKTLPLAFNIVIGENIQRDMPWLSFYLSGSKASGLNLVCLLVPRTTTITLSYILSGLMSSFLPHILPCHGCPASKGLFWITV